MDTFTLDVDACSKVITFLEIGEFRDGSPIKTPIGVIRGKNAGPTQ
jgi:hypothetical protein